MVHVYGCAQMIYKDVVEDRDYGWNIYQLLRIEKGVLDV